MLRSFVVWMVEGIWAALASAARWNERRQALGREGEAAKAERRRFDARLAASFADLQEVERRLPAQPRVVCPQRAAELERELERAAATRLADGCILRAAELEVRASVSARHGTLAVPRVADLRRRATVLREVATAFPALTRAGQHLLA